MHMGTMLTISHDNLSKLLKSAARQGALEALAILNPSKGEISKREAERRYGTIWIRVQLAKGRLNTYRKTGSKNSTIYLKVQEIESLRQSEINILSVDE